MVIPGEFHLKNYTSKLNFEKKKFSGSVSKSRKRPFGDVGQYFLLVEKKVDHSVFLREIYRRLP